MMAYTSEDVHTTCKIIEKLTITLQKGDLPKRYADFLELVTTTTKQEYKKVAKHKPEMEFIFAGFDFHSKLKVETRKLQLALRLLDKRMHSDRLQNLRVIPPSTLHQPFWQSKHFHEKQ